MIMMFKKYNIALSTGRAEILVSNVVKYNIV